MGNTFKIVRPSGILDGTKVYDLRQEVSKILKTNTDIVLVDLKDTIFMDSSGLGALVLSLKEVKTAGARLFLCSLNDQIKMLFELTSMDRVFDIFSNREEFEQKILESNFNSKMADVEANEL